MIKKFVTVILLLCLGACLGGYSPDSSFYRLPSLNRPDQTFSAKKSISVSKIGLPEYLDRPQMVIIDETSPKIEIAEFHRWGEDLNNMIQRKVSSDLSRYLPLSKIADTNEEVQKTNFDIKIEILRLDMIKQGKVVLEARWYIFDNQGKIIKKGQFSQSETIKPDYAEYAAATAELLSQMDLEIAQALSKN